MAPSQDSCVQYIGCVVNPAVISVVFDSPQACFGAPLKFAAVRGPHLTKLSALRFLDARLHIRFRGVVLSSGCYDLSMTRSMRDSNHPKRLLSKMVAQLRSVFMPNTISEKRWHASKVPFANLKAYGDEGRLPSILLEPGMENLLLEDSGRSLSSCVMECRTDFAEPTGKDEQCK
ncbi:hypothetical protein BDR22DRAFT_969613 [Usnea florida]